MFGGNSSTGLETLLSESFMEHQKGISLWSITATRLEQLGETPSSTRYKSTFSSTSWSWSCSYIKNVSLRFDFLAEVFPVCSDQIRCRRRKASERFRWFLHRGWQRCVSNTAVCTTEDTELTSSFWKKFPGNIGDLKYDIKLCMVSFTSILQRCLKNDI